MYNATALGAVIIYCAQEPGACSVGQDARTKLTEFSVRFYFFFQLPQPLLLTLKEVTWTWWCFLLCKCLVHHLWQSQGGRKVCVSERRHITALTMLHRDSQNCRTSIIILRNMPRQGEALRESRAPPDTALWHMVFKHYLHTIGNIRSSFEAQLGSLVQ